MPGKFFITDSKFAPRNQREWDWVIRDATDLSSSEKLVLFALNSRYNGSSVVFPSFTQMAKDTGLTDRACKNKINGETRKGVRIPGLVDKGWLDKTAGNRIESNHYKLSLPEHIKVVRAQTGWKHEGNEEPSYSGLHYVEGSEPGSLASERSTPPVVNQVPTKRTKEEDKEDNNPLAGRARSEAIRKKFHSAAVDNLEELLNGNQDATRNLEPRERSEPGEIETRRFFCLNQKSGRVKEISRNHKLQPGFKRVDKNHPSVQQYLKDNDDPEYTGK